MVLNMNGKLPNTSKKAVVFVDLSSSTALFESIGDESATNLVHTITKDIAQHLELHHGRVVKFLGDGVLAIFEQADWVVKACLLLNKMLIETEESVSQALLGLDRISVRVGIDYGTIVEVEDDVYGDTVNVASRILSLAKPGELMMTGAVFEQLDMLIRQKCRRLGRMSLQGKTIPELVYGLSLSHEESVEGITQFNETDIFSSKKPSWETGSSFIELEHEGQIYRFSSHQMPVIIGRSADCDLQVFDARVSRTHVRLDWLEGQFYLTDISINGTMVQYKGDVSGAPLPLSMRRQRCSLLRQGSIILGLLPRHTGSGGDKKDMPPVFHFRVVENEIQELRV